MKVVGCVTVRFGVSAFVTVVVTGNVIGSMQQTYVWRVSIVVMSVVSVVCVIVAAKAISNRDNALYYSMADKREETKILSYLVLFMIEKKKIKVISMLKIECFSLQIGKKRNAILLLKR